MNDDKKDEEMRFKLAASFKGAVHIKATHLGWEEDVESRRRPLSVRLEGKFQVCVKVGIRWWRIRRESFGIL